MYSTTLSPHSINENKTTIIYIQCSLIDFIRGSVCSAQYVYIYCQPSNCSPTGEYPRQVGRTMWCRDLANCVLHHLSVNNYSKSNVKLSPRYCLQNLQVQYWLYAVGVRRHAKNCTVMAVTKFHLVQAVFHPRRTISSNKLTMIVPQSSCKYCSLPLYIQI